MCMSLEYVKSWRVFVAAQGTEDKIAGRKEEKKQRPGVFDFWHQNG